MFQRASQCCIYYIQNVVFWFLNLVAFVMFIHFPFCCLLFVLFHNIRLINHLGIRYVNVFSHSHSILYTLSFIHKFGHGTFLLLNIGNGWPSVIYRSISFETMWYSSLKHRKWKHGNVNLHLRMISLYSPLCMCVFCTRLWVFPIKIICHFFYSCFLHIYYFFSANRPIEYDGSRKIKL